MRYENAATPAGLAWSSPFARWQGSLAELSSLDLAADAHRAPLGHRTERRTPPERGRPVHRTRRGDTGAAAVIRVDD